MRRAAGRRRASRSRLILVLGGASSGKSDRALALARPTRARGGRGAYVATAQALDKEMAAKIRRHRSARGAAWVTAEVPIDLAAWLDKEGRQYQAIVLDCLTLWLTNLSSLGLAEQAVLGRTDELIRAARRTGARVVLVSNELGLGLVPPEPASRAFRDLAGRVHQLVARDAHEVYLVVAGCSMKIK